MYNTWKIVLGLSRSDGKEKSRKSGSDGPVTVESWLFGLGFQDFVSTFIEFGYDNLNFVVSTLVKYVINLYKFNLVSNVIISLILEWSTNRFRLERYGHRKRKR